MSIQVAAVANLNLIYFINSDIVLVVTCDLASNDILGEKIR